MARITALRLAGGDRVAVELDDRPWRVVPGDALVRAGLWEGSELDRPRARRLRRELRRSEALAVAGRTLRRRAASASELDTRLERAGVAPGARAEALALLRDAGLVDDERTASAAADALAARGWGDAAIASRLEQLGIDGDTAARARGRLEPEGERAEHVAAARGRSRRTAAWLRRRGFSEDAIEAAVPAALAEDGEEGYDVGSSRSIFPA